jgi:hypothetical protein
MSKVVGRDDPPLMPGELRQRLTVPDLAYLELSAQYMSVTRYAREKKSWPGRKKPDSEEEQEKRDWQLVNEHRRRQRKGANFYS